MNPEMFVALMSTICMLGMKEHRSKEETLAYDNFLAYSGSVARFNRLVVEDETSKALDEGRSDGSGNKRVTTRLS